MNLALCGASILVEWLSLGHYLNLILQTVIGYQLLQYSRTLGVPDSIYARFDIVSDTCHPAPCYLNSNKVFCLLRDRYCNPEQGFEPGSSSESLFEFDTCSKPLGHHGRFIHQFKPPIFLTNMKNVGPDFWIQVAFQNSEKADIFDKNAF